jgi:hypothetical protein
MKQIFLFIAFLALSFIIPSNTYGQISIKTEGTTTIDSYVMKSLHCSVKHYNDAYYLVLDNINNAKPMEIHLGKNKEETYESLNSLYSWYKNAKNKEYIVFQSENKDITLYRLNAVDAYFSTNSVEYIKSLIKGATWGFSNNKVDENSSTSHIEFLPKLLKRAMDNLSNMED